MAGKWDDMSDIEKIRNLRRAAKDLRKGGKEATWIEPGYREGVADIFDAAADRIEAGEDPRVEEEESPERLKAQAEVARSMVHLLKRYDAGSLAALLKRWGIEVEE